MRFDNNGTASAGIYVRLSREDRHKANDSDDSESIINQRRMLLDYCRQHDLHVYDIYNDEDFSGSDRERPEFNRMIADAESGKINVIICKTQSRFARDVEIVERYINGLFPLWGVRFIGVVDNTDSTSTSTLKQRQISSLVDQWYIADLSENVRATLASKRRDGLWVGAFAPYGYIKDPNNKNRLIIDDEAADVVRYVFSLYLSGMGIAAITRKLNDEGIPNPAVYKQQHGQPFQNAHRECSRLWHTYAVGRMLSNEVYIGNVVQGRTETISYKSKKKRRKSRDDWDIVENVHEPIISREVWDSVQRLRAGKPNPRQHSETPNLFSAKVRCRRCGGSMRVFYNRHHRYFRCSTHFIAGGRCEGTYISESTLSQVVLDEIKKLYNKFIDEEVTADALESLHSCESRLRMLRSQLKSTNADIEQLDKRLAALYVDKLDGVITSEEFVALKWQFSDEKKSAEENISRLNRNIEEITARQSSGRSCLEMIRRYKDIQNLSFDTVHTLIDHVEVGGDRSSRVVDIYWNI